MKKELPTLLIIETGHDLGYSLTSLPREFQILADDNLPRIKELIAKKSVQAVLMSASLSESSSKKILSTLQEELDTSDTPLILICNNDYPLSGFPGNEACQGSTEIIHSSTSPQQIASLLNSMIPA